MLAVRGKIDKEIAASLGICKSTLNNWKQRHPEFDATLRAGKDLVDDMVEASLLKRALGYNLMEVTRERVYDKTLEKWRTVITKKVTKHVHADTLAINSWLNNRRPSIWRDRRRIDGRIDVNLKKEPDLSGLTDGQLNELEQYTEHLFSAN